MGTSHALCAQPWAGPSQGGQKVETQVLPQGTGAFWARGQEGSVGGGLEPGDVRRPSCTALPKAPSLGANPSSAPGASPSPKQGNKAIVRVTGAPRAQFFARVSKRPPLLF